MQSRSIVIAFALFLCVPAVMVRRQADDSQEDGTPGWDAFIRDKTDVCNEFGAEFSANQFCSIFEKCCKMNYDPLNGDRCQTLDMQCESPESFSCILRNCTEMITTTTTTEMPTTEESANTAERLVALFSSSIAVLLALH